MRSRIETGGIALGEQSLEFVLAVPGRKYHEFTDLLVSFIHDGQGEVLDVLRVKKTAVSQQLTLL